MIEGIEKGQEKTIVNWKRQSHNTEDDEIEMATMKWGRRNGDEEMARKKWLARNGDEATMMK